MQFLKFNFKVTSADSLEIGKNNPLEYAEASKTYMENNPKNFICFTRTDRQIFNGCAIFSEYIDAENEISNFVKNCKIEFEKVNVKEITTLMMHRYLYLAFDNELCEGPCDILNSLGIKALERDHGYEETTLDLNNVTKENLIKEAKDMLYSSTLVEEIERIFSCKNVEVIGNPVHYLILEDDAEIRKEVARILAKALALNHRFKGTRLTFDPYNDNRRDIPNLSGFSGDIYRANKDGIINIDFYRDETLSSGSAFAKATSNFIQIIKALCKNMKFFKNDVLTIFSTTEKDQKVVNAFYSNLGDIKIIEIKHDLANSEESIYYLKNLAQKHNIEPDENLFKKLKENGKYNNNELIRMFDTWFNEKLNTDIYPAYSEIVPIDAKAELEEKGSGYEKLSNLIGLKNAKEVIDSAINYYKAQKLFASKGISNNKVAMHMCFTGNPGTAKTTVARLFADIMRENGILSKGELIEVGRGDLVGQYVGHTAPLVQSAFKRAKGNVLFIDEAYSLVDDKDGLFGDEAINTIVQEMENNRDDTIVIFAGYPDKMEKFIDKNPGLKSRIAFHVKFDDYSPDELCKIAESIAKDSNLTISKEAMPKLNEIFAQAVQNKDFGNGRFARNAIEKAQMKQASRLVNMDYDKVEEKDITTLCKSDFEGFTYEKSQAKKCIGF